MPSFAMLFPGQGSQYIGMLSSYLSKKNNIIKYTFDEASNHINHNLIKLTQEKSDKKLNRNKYIQVAILTASVSIYRLWEEKNGQLPSIMSGHSLGEYSALVCSNSITFADALKIVFFRGKLMEKNAIKRPSLMKAIIGLDKKIVKKICSMYSKKKIVSLASINSNDQIVISGDKSAVFKASHKCKKIGAKYILNLNVNIGSHCKLMKPISKKLKKKLDNIPINSPKIPVINNVEVKCENIKNNIKRALIRQIYSTVRWKETIDLIKSKNIFIMLEVGPNKILTNLNKKCKQCMNFDTNNVKNFLRAFKKINNKE